MISMNKILKTAMKSGHNNHKHATLLFRGGALMAAGANSNKKHSEHVALTKVKHKGGAKNMIAVNIRLTKGGQIGMSKPCPTCEQELRDAGVRAVKYTGADGIFHTEVY